MGHVDGGKLALESYIHITEQESRERIKRALTCRRLTRAQAARTMIDHGYIETSAGRVHRAAELVCESARDFIGRYRTWIEPYLKDSTDQKP